jgi:leader peptidase (prepilin peptidase) / N-methyltransferase
MEYLLAFVFGAVIGSFLNVCIVRLPAGQSIVSPASRCPACGNPVLRRDNIPLISYLLLRGRCRACRSRISLRYPAVEALTGLLFALLLYRIGPLPLVAAYASFVAALIVISFIDLDHQIIPDVISLPGIVVGLLLSAIGYGPALLDSVAGVLVGGGLLYAVAVGYHALTGREGMGGGDIKLLAMIGAFLGWTNALVTLVLGSLGGALIGIGLILVRGADSRVPIPFGPFLALGALCALLFGDALLQWYLHLALPS